MNGDKELIYPKWQRGFREVLLEFDLKKLNEKIQKCEAAVFTRLQELASDSDHHDERQALADAVSTMFVLKKEKSAT